MNINEHNNSKVEKITLIEPSSAGSHIFSYYKIPRLGLPVLGSSLKARGCDVKIYVEDIKAVNYRDAFSSDLVGISCTSSTAPRGYSIAQKLTEQGVPVVMGGFHPTFMPEESLKYCNYVVRGEGENTIIELIDAIEGKLDINDVKGLSYRAGKGEIVKDRKSVV